MKKLISIILLAAIIFGCITGCAPTPEPTPDPDPVVDPEPTPDPDPVVDPEPTPDPESTPDPEPVPDPEPPMERAEEIDYDDPEWFKDTMIIDIDSDWPHLYLTSLSSESSIRSQAKGYFRQLSVGTRVTDISLNLFEQTSFVESDVMSWIYEEVAARVAESGPIDGFDRINATHPKLYEAFTELGLDWYQMALDLIEEAGIRPWIYLRMNDLHYVTNPESPYHDEFWFEAQENGWLIEETAYGAPPRSGEPISMAYDFANEEVRAWMLAYIEEILSKYDAFGLELDFMRNIYCFDYLNDEDCAEIMTQFIRDVKALLDEAAERNGHDMKLMVRVCRSIEDSLTFGFDVASWVEEDLIDAIAPSPRAYIDSEIPVADWKALVGEDVAVFPGFENYLMGEADPTIEHIKGYAASYYSRGADGLYFDNFFQLGSLGPQVWPLSRRNMNEGTRIYAVSSQDTYPLGTDPDKPMPLALHAAPEEGLDFEIYPGIVREKEYVYVVAGYTYSFKTEFVTEVSLNGVQPVSVTKIKSNDSNSIRGYVNDGNTGQYRKKAGTIIVYAFEKIAVEEGEPLVVHFTQNPGDKCNVEYLEVLVSNSEYTDWD